MNIGHFSKTEYVKFFRRDNALDTNGEVFVLSFVWKKVLEKEIPVIRFMDMQNKFVWDFKTAEVKEYVHEDEVVTGVFRTKEKRVYFPASLATVKRIEGDKII